MRFRALSSKSRDESDAAMALRLDCFLAILVRICGCPRIINADGHFRSYVREMASGQIERAAEIAALPSFHRSTLTIA